MMSERRVIAELEWLEVTLERMSHAPAVACCLVEALADTAFGLDQASLENMATETHVILAEFKFQERRLGNLCAAVRRARSERENRGQLAL
jgi:hypothetical protein